MASAHRRDFLLGLAANAIALPPLTRRGRAAVETDAPAEGSLSATAIGGLLQQDKVPGASLAIFENGDLVATYCYGVAQPDRQVTAQTRFQAASLSKTVNALALLKLVQAGRIKLDDPVNKHLKSWKLPVNALTANVPVTIRMLLSHTGGTNVHGFAGYPRGAGLPGLRDTLDGRKPANSPAIRVTSQPGKEHRYSGGGIAVLQQMMLDVTGEAYPALLERTVLGPLGMSESSFRQPPDTATVAQAAFGYTANATVIAGDFRIYPEMAAAGLWTTPRDYAKALIAIIRSHAGEAGAFLDQMLAREMLTPGPGQAGLGTFINAAGIFNHGGANEGFRCLYLADPKTGRGLVAMTNGANGDKVCGALRQRVVRSRRWG